MGRRWTPPLPTSAVRHCRPISPRSAHPTSTTRPITRRCLRPTTARSRLLRLGGIFTPALEAALREHGVGINRLTLHVGAGTFLPVKVDDTTEHKMHSEWGTISPEVAERLNAARAKGGRIVAIGTTSMRLLESATTEHGIGQPF